MGNLDDEDRKGRFDKSDSPLYSCSYLLRSCDVERKQNPRSSDMIVRFDGDDTILVQNGCHMWLKVEGLRGYVFCDDDGRFYYPQWWY